MTSIEIDSFAQLKGIKPSSLRPWKQWYYECFKNQTLSRYPHRWSYRLTNTQMIFFGGYKGKNDGLV